MTPNLTAIRQRHVANEIDHFDGESDEPVKAYTCATCITSMWPCDTARVLEEVDNLNCMIDQFGEGAGATLRKWYAEKQRADRAEADLTSCMGALEEALHCIEIQNMYSYDEQPTVEIAIENGYWCKMAMDARAAILVSLTKLDARRKEA